MAGLILEAGQVLAEDAGRWRLPRHYNTTNYDPALRRRPACPQPHPNPGLAHQRLLELLDHQLNLRCQFFHGCHDHVGWHGRIVRREPFVRAVGRDVIFDGKADHEAIF